MAKKNQSLIQVRVEDKLKEDVSAIFDELGLDLPTAIRIFLKRSSQVHGIPFDMRLTEETVTRLEGQMAFEALREQGAERPEIGLEEINREIKASRAERKG